MQAAVVIIAKYFILLPVGITIWEFMRLSGSLKFKFAVQLVIGGGLSLVLAIVAGILIHDPRPFVAGHFTPLITHSTDNGFPSDHALLGALLGWSTLIYSKKLGIISLGCAVAIGLARMAAGVHHSWDILGSFVIAGAATLVTATAVNALASKRQLIAGSGARRNSK